MSTPPQAARPRFRPPGLLILAGVVLLGILPGAGWFHYKAPQVKAEVIGRLKAAPGDPEEKLLLWLSYGEPQIQSRLSHLRFSARQPWLVTHSVDVPGGEPEIHGLVFDTPRPGRIVREGLRVEIHLDRPHLLGHGRLRGDNADRIPHYPSREVVPDPAERVEELARWFLGGLIAALPREIPGAELVILVGGAAEGAVGD